MSGVIGIARRPSRREGGLVAVAVFAAVASVLALTWTLRNPFRDPTQAAVTVYGSLMFTFVGVVVLWRRPGHGIGRLALVIGLLFSLSAAISGALDWWQPGYAVRVVRFGPLKTAYELLESFANLLAVAGLILGVVLLITWFPDGRRSSRLGGLVEGALVAGVVTATLGSLREPILAQVGWSRTLDDILTVLQPVAVVLFTGAWVGSVVDLAHRYRRSDPIRRTQMRWVLVASATTATMLIAVLGLGDVLPGIWAAALTSLGLPVLAVAVAITRYHLYDIDRIVSRSISYLLVTALLFVVFGGMILLLQSIISGVVAGPGSTLDPRVVAASTLVVAALFNPVRIRVQSIVDRRFHRARYDAERTVAGFAGRLRDQLDLPTLTCGASSDDGRRRRTDDDVCLAARRGTMTATTRRPLPTRGGGQGGLVLAIAFAVTVVAITLAFSVVYDAQDRVSSVAAMYFCSMYTAVGVLILRRRPGHGMGRLSLFLGVTVGVSIILTVLTTALMVHVPPVAGGPEIVELHRLAYDVLGMVAASLAAFAVVGGLVLLITWFPAGRATSRLGEAVQVLFVVAMVVLQIAAGNGLTRSLGWPPLDENQLAIGERLGYVMLLVALAGAIVDLSRRYRHGDPVTRAQTRWLVAASTCILVATIAVLLFGEWSEVIWYIWLVSFGLPILAVAVAITRYHLYDIDRIVSRSIAYVVVTAPCSSGLRWADPASCSRSSAARSPNRVSALDPRVVAASTLVVAALFNPVRHPGPGHRRPALPPGALRRRAHCRRVRRSAARPARPADPDRRAAADHDPRGRAGDDRGLAARQGRRGMSRSLMLARFVAVTSLALILGVVVYDTLSGWPAGAGQLALCSSTPRWV